MAYKIITIGEILTFIVNKSLFTTKWATYTVHVSPDIIATPTLL